MASSTIEHPAAVQLPIGYGRRHSPERVEAMASMAGEVMAMDEMTVLSLIASKHGLPVAMPCPACAGFALEFSLSAPDALHCGECDAKVDADSFPATGAVSGANSLGEMVSYAYHEKGRRRYFIDPRIRFLRHQHLAGVCRAVAYQYYTTGEEASARRAIAMLVRFADVYRRWPVVQWANWQTLSLGPTRPYDSPRIGRWAHRTVYEIPLDLLAAYDLTYTSPEWDRFAAASGWELRRRLETDLFRAALELTQDHNADRGYLHNLQASQFLRMIHMGRVLNDPDLVHEAVSMMHDMVRAFYHFDGMEYEGSASYHGLVTGRLSVAAGALRGYTDPPGYVNERSGIRFDEPLDFREALPVLDRAWHIARELSFPNGIAVPIHDTAWAKNRKDTPDDAEASSIELNAFGHFSLGRGRGDDAMEAHLHFCPDARAPGHAHDDRLSLILWAAGEEVLSDMGYVHSGKIHQYFAHHAIAHNTVTAVFDDPPDAPEIPEPEEHTADPVQARAAEAARVRPLADARSSLLAYAPGIVSGQQVQLVEASSPGPPWRGVSMRRRALLMVAAGDRRSYVVDWFRIAGGDMHQFVLRPSLDEDVSAECSLELSVRPGTLAGAEVPYGQGVSKWRGPWEPLIHSLKTAATEAPYQIQFEGAESQARVRCFFRGQSESTVILAKSPSMRRAHNDDRYADTYQGPHLLVRRRDRSGLGSLFGAVYDAWSSEGAAVIDEVSWLDLGDGAASAAVAVSIRLGEREDIVYTSLDAVPRTVAGVRFAGRFAICSRMNGQPQWAWAHHDGAVAASGLRLRCAPTVRLPLNRVLRRQGGAAVNGFEVRGALPDAAVVPGQWVRAVFADGQAYGYCVDSVEQLGDRTRISIRGEPGFQLTDTGVQLLYHPFYETPGDCQLEIAGTAFVHIQADLLPQP